MYIANVRRRHKRKRRKFLSYFNEWFEFIHTPGLALSTVKRYEQELRLRLNNSQIMQLPIDKVKAIDIHIFYKSLQTNNSSINSIRIIHNLLSAFFKYCVKEEILIKNPMDAVQFPKFSEIKLNKKRHLTNQDVKKILTHAETYIEAFIFIFAIFTGLRQGEILALTYKDLEDDKVWVSKTIYILDQKIICSKGKTSKSIRDVPLLSNLMPMYEAHIALEKEKHRKRGILFSEESIVFSSHTCGYINGRTLRRKLSDLCEQLDIEPINFHGLRHTFCTNLAKGGVGLKTASLLMGHTNPNTTMRVYTHVQEEDKLHGVASLGGMFFK